MSRSEEERRRSDLDALLDEQVRYYRARAPEYEATAPVYDATRRPDDPYASIAAEAISALRALGPGEITRHDPFWWATVKRSHDP